MYKRVLVPTDGSVVSERAEKAAVEVARKFGAAVTVVHVVAPYSPGALAEIGGLGPLPLTPQEYRDAAEKRGKAALRRVTARAKRAGLRADAVMVTSPDAGEALVKAAHDSGCDLIVMGSSSRVGIERIFIGSVASDVLSGTRTPALICH